MSELRGTWDALRTLRRPSRKARERADDSSALRRHIDSPERRASNEWVEWIENIDGAWPVLCSFLAEFARACFRDRVPLSRAASGSYNTSHELSTRGVYHEGRHSSQVRRGDRDVRLRQQVHHAQHEEEHHGRNLL